MIHLDGRVERLVENNEDSNVDPWEITNGAAGFNSVSRHIVYVGGLSSSLMQKNRVPKDTRTDKQKESMEKYVKDFHSRFPDTRIVGHHDLNPGKACPCFDVMKWLVEIGLN